jgi:hypothetical protein
MSRKFLQSPVKHWEPYGETERARMPFCFLCPEGKRRRFVKCWVRVADNNGLCHGFSISLCHRHLLKKDYERQINEKLLKIFGTKERDNGKNT